MTNNDIATYMIDCLGYSVEDTTDSDGLTRNDLWWELTPGQQIECIKFIQED